MSSNIDWEKFRHEVFATAMTTVTPSSSSIDIDDGSRSNDDKPPVIIMMGSNNTIEGETTKGSFVPIRLGSSDGATMDELTLESQIQNIFQFERYATNHSMAPSTGAYVNYGSEDEESLRANRDGFTSEKYKLRPRILHDVSHVDTSTTILQGRVRLQFPICVAPFAGCRAIHPDGEIAVATAATKAGTVFTVPNWSSIPVETIIRESTSQYYNDDPGQNPQNVPPPPLFFQLYPHKPVKKGEGIHREHMRRLLEYLADNSACTAGSRRIVAIVVTCDTINNGNREKTYKNSQWLIDVVDEVGGFPKPCALKDCADLPPIDEEGNPSTMTWNDIRWMKNECEKYSLALILKGIMAWEDAIIAAEIGVDAIIVSNHGGRQLDSTQSTVEVVEECVAALAHRVPDATLEVYVDGGIRRGKDVVKCLALGAKCVFVGRPILWGLAVGGRLGVSHALNILQTEFQETLELMGCRNPKELQRSHISCTSNKNDDARSFDEGVGVSVAAGKTSGSEAATNSASHRIPNLKWITATVGIAFVSFLFGRSSADRIRRRA